MFYSIYYFERPSIDEVTSFHAFVALVREQPECVPEIVQELHFKPSCDDDANKAQANTNMRVSLYDYPVHDPSELPYFAHIAGVPEVIMPLWVNALQAAKAIQGKNIVFDHGCSRAAFNCRAGAIALLNAMGLEYGPVIQREHGIDAGLWQHIRSDVPPLNDPLSAYCELTEELAAGMP